MTQPPAQTEATALRGRTEPWGRVGLALLAASVLAGLWLRVRGLSAEGFGDDEVHKWLAALRYLQGDFGGDDVEHPMLMKWLITLAILVGRPLGWAPETMTRLPVALAGTASVVATALLARRLYGRAVGLWAGALAAVAVSHVAYNRVAKEDTFLGLFLLLHLWAFAEAKAAADDARTGDQRRWELWGAAFIAGMFASKYFFFHALIPLLTYAWLRRTGTAWHVPLKRWLQLVGVALAIWMALNWSPLLPSTWEYAKSYTTGQQTVHGSLLFMGRIYHNLTEYMLAGTPPWYYAVFAAVKLAPLTFALSLAGLALALRTRAPSHRVILAWMGFWFFVHSPIGSKWGRFFTTVMPAFLILAAYATHRLLVWLQARAPASGAFARAPSWGAAAVSLLLVGSEAQASVAFAPHYKLYISPLGGGASRVTWFFPHCDFWDMGFREAMQLVAQKAEPGAEVSTEIDWPAKLYAEQFQRRDLKISLTRRGRSCQSGSPCYVLLQPGRKYFLNREAVDNLSGREPWQTVQVRGIDVVRIYRLPPNESPFADENVAATTVREPEERTP